MNAFQLGLAGAGGDRALLRAALERMCAASLAALLPTKVKKGKLAERPPGSAPDDRDRHGQHAPERGVNL
jgi:hypothetical protein